MDRRGPLSDRQRGQAGCIAARLRQELSPPAATVFASKTPTDGSFRARVIAIVRRIPRGRVATYGDVAALAGRPRAWRAVGTIMRNCRLPSVPCHRVVGAGGRLGGYSDPLRKRRLLQEEGIVVGRGTIQQFDALRWTPPRPRGR